VRDAFRDESESDSSEADDEDNDSGDEDADSDDDSRRAPKAARKSPQKQIQTDLPVEPVATPPMPITTVPAESDISIPISVSGQSLASTSMSEMPSGQSYTDRLKIDLPTFETSAPLPSVPATPQLSVDTADESLAAGPSPMSHMSESELSSGGERSSILKTLTGLWAFRAGEITPLVYPLSANDHIFADSRVIIRENEPTSIIAFTLNSKMYRDKMKNATYAQSVKSEAFMPEDGSTDRASTWDVVSLDEAMDGDDPYRREGGTHLKYGE
jgi:1-phosphatidylinositol-3-phosphate 5-kinase